MLLRAYVIRLADGLVASRDQSSVVTDIHRRFPIHFASAKVGVSNDFKCQVDIKLITRNLWACPPCADLKGISAQLVPGFWLAVKIIVPLHRQSNERANDGYKDGTIERTSVGALERCNAITQERWKERTNVRVMEGTSFPSILKTNVGSDHPSHERCSEPSNEVRNNRSIECSNLRTID